MTDRHRALIVLLDQDRRADDLTDGLVTAIRQLRGVSVVALVDGDDATIARHARALDERHQAIRYLQDRLRALIEDDPG